MNESKRTSTQKSELRKVFICSPFRPKGSSKMEIEQSRRHNIALAQYGCKFALEVGCIPFAPHLYFTQFLSDGIEAERKIGRKLGLIWLTKCDELWVIGEYVSSGMQDEIMQALKCSIPVRQFVCEHTHEERILAALFGEAFGELKEVTYGKD